jgi:hypothetical protein
LPRPVYSRGRQTGRCQPPLHIRDGRGTSLFREVVDRECVGGGFRCASARASGINFQACLIGRSSISAFRINDLRTAWDSASQNPPSNAVVCNGRLYSASCGAAARNRRRNCVRPPEVIRSVTADHASVREAAALRAAAGGTNRIACGIRRLGPCSGADRLMSADSRMKARPSRRLRAATRGRDLTTLVITVTVSTCMVGPRRRRSRSLRCV